MRVLCVGRHKFLSEHLCRFFRDLGAHCESAVGVAAAASVGTDFEPHLLVADSDLLSPAVLDAWSASPVLHEVPVLAVSLTRRPEEHAPSDVCGYAGVIYLPGLSRDEALALLDGARRPLGVNIPFGATVLTSRQSVATH
jgi:hypothetical protein